MKRWPGKEQMLAAGVALDKLEASKPSGTLEKLTAWAQNIVNTALGKKPPLNKKIAYPVFQVRVDQDGLYRLNYEELVAATGVGLAGVPAADLALTQSVMALRCLFMSAGEALSDPAAISNFTAKPWIRCTPVPRC